MRDIESHINALNSFSKIFLPSIFEKLKSFNLKHSNLDDINVLLMKLITEYNSVIYDNLKLHNNEKVDISNICEIISSSGRFAESRIR